MTIQHLVFSKSDSDSNWTEIVASTKSVSMTNEEKYMLVVTYKLYTFEKNLLIKHRIVKGSVVGTAAS